MGKSIHSEDAMNEKGHYTVKAYRAGGKFLYRDDDHTYWRLDEGCGEYFRIPSVTEIIKPILNYSSVPEYVLEEARNRGKNIHATIKLWIEGRLDEEQLDEGNRIALDSFKAWWDKERLDYDQLIMDIKTRKPYIPYDSVQLAAYEILATQGTRVNPSIPGGRHISIYYEEPIWHEKLKFGGTPDYVRFNLFHAEKYVLYLKPTGGYEFVNVSRRQAASIFRKLLKKWWNDFDTNLMVEKWRKTK